MLERNAPCVIKEYKLPHVKGVVKLSLTHEYTVLGVDSSSGVVLVRESNVLHKNEVEFELVESSQIFDHEPSSRGYIGSFQVNGKYLHLIGRRESVRLGGAC